MLASSRNLVCLPLLSHAGDQRHQERVRCGAACALLRSTEIVFGFAGRRVVDWIKVAGKDEPKDEVFQGERAKVRVKVSCTAGQAEHPHSIRGVWGGVPGPGSSPESCVKAWGRGSGAAGADGAPVWL